jgi:hypothetical protein
MSSKMVRRTIEAIGSEHQKQMGIADLFENLYPRGVCENPSVVTGSGSLTKSLASFFNEKLDLAIKMRSERMDIQPKIKEGKPDELKRLKNEDNKSKKDYRSVIITD